MSLFRINFEDFLEKVKWNVTDNSHIKVLYETAGDMLIFYLLCPEGEFCTVMNKNNLTPVDMMNLKGRTIPTVRIKDEISLDKKTIESLKINLEKQINITEDASPEE